MFDCTKKFALANDEFKHVSLRFSSNKIVIYNSNHTHRPSTHQTEQAKINFERKKYNGFMSRQTKSYITKILDNWFMTVRHYNKYEAYKNNHHGKKMVFVTLTLPSKQMHSDNVIKREVLNKFIVTCRSCKIFDMYFWRAEKQKNGNIHFHLLIDVFIDKKKLQSVWNKCLENLGYINEYEKKFSKRNAPSTHIQEIPSGQNIIDYVIKYIGKNEGTCIVEGRIWGMSDKLRELQSLRIDEDSSTSKLVDEFIKDNCSNVYQDENCMVVMVEYSQRIKYYNMLEKNGLNKVMSANCAYLYMNGDLPTNILYPRKVVPKNIPVEKKKPTQFELFEKWFYNITD